MRTLSILFALWCTAAAAAPAEAPPLDDLLKLYREYGLPLPPPDAPLAQTPTGWSRQLDSGKMAPVLTLGFLLKPAEGGKPAELLVGPLHFAPELSREDGPAKLVKPDEVAVEKLSFSEWNSTFPLDTALATAIQCHARGYEKLAQALYERGLIVEGPGGPTAVSSGGPWMRHGEPAAFDGKPGADARTILAGVAWTYWLNELYRPGSEWPACVREGHASHRSLSAGARR